MATKKFADHTLYHVAPQGFWKRFRDTVVVNPEISSGIPIAPLNRHPQPGSRPEKYSAPATRASDPADNPYWKRDVRRAYPKLSVITQTDMSFFLLQQPALQAQIGEPETKATDSASVLATAKAPLSLTEAIATMPSAGKTYSQSKLPPRLKTSYPRWIPAEAEPAPHDPNAYFPMSLVK